MFLVDSHCHLDLLNYTSIHSDLNDVIKKSESKGIKLILTVSTSIKNFCDLLHFIKNNNKILLSCGIHPCNIPKNKNDISKLKQYATSNKVHAIGETGLDYISTHDKKSQQILFRKHIRIAKKLNKPLLVHTRKAINDTINILKEENTTSNKVIFHSFTENIHFAKILLDMGFYISFSGIVTFKNANIVRETAKFVPIENMLIETDSPYLSPVPYRGKENQPAYLYKTTSFISKLKKIDPDNFSQQTTKNFLKLFNYSLNSL
ncbi:MAG: YchF/TatD family DNA exonuclease [Buchnera aphidicola (Chaetogeoica yunlongensis)]